MSESTVLLIGGTGFIGRALYQSLLSRDFAVHVLSRHATPPGEYDPAFFHATSLDDVATLKELLPQCGTVYFLASDTTPGKSSRHPSLEGELNILPTLRFLETLQQYEHTRLIYVSSGGTVYGDASDAQQTESSPQRPISYYGAGKLAIESFLGAFQRQFRRQVVILRPSNLYGPGQPYLDHFGLIPKLLEHSYRGSKIDIWGNGQHIRDYLYISDFLEACLRLSSPPQPATHQLKTYNVGSGVGHTINQLCEIIDEVTGRHLKRRYRPARIGDVKRVVLDCKNIKQDTGWQATTTIHDGIEQTWRWLVQQKK